ncbi:hypothetical protein IM538_01395 [Cytobacillus suaedae]|nr:hypothetical protein IM538_01395 [Cytobacillus suaedae]
MNEREVIHSFFNHRIGILATMHHKEKVMSPLLEDQLGIKVNVPNNVNTDQFGTFTREIERMGDQLEAAKHKAEYAMSLTGETLAISSEGIFGPHPFLPWVPYNREIVFLTDKENEFEIFGEAITTDTNYKHMKIEKTQEALEFCETVGFPEHAVIVRNKDQIIKGIHTHEQLEDAVNYFLKKSKAELFIETDMRALYNPTRMRNIKSATENLIKKIYSLCSKCSFPGFEVVERKEGLLCSSCGIKTNLIKSEIYKCKKCGEQEEKLYPNGKQFADPGHCPICNP